MIFTGIVGLPLTKTTGKRTLAIGGRRLPFPFPETDTSVSENPVIFRPVGVRFVKLLCGYRLLSVQVQWLYTSIKRSLLISQKIAGE